MSVVHEVLIVSPSDASSQKDVICEAVMDWNSSHAAESRITLNARRWELDSVPATGNRAQEILNKQLVDAADILIAVFFARLGSPTGAAMSGTVEEIQRARYMQKPVLIYFSQAPIPRDHDTEQFRLLNDFKRQIAPNTLYAEFEDNESLRRLVSKHLPKTISELMKSPKYVWAHFNSKKTSTHNGQRMYEEMIPGNFVSCSVEAPCSMRKVVETVARRSQKPIPIDRLTERLNYPILPRGVALLDKSAVCIENVLDNYSNLDWWFSDIGLNVSEREQD